MASSAEATAGRRWAAPGPHPDPARRDRADRRAGSRPRAARSPSIAASGSCRQARSTTASYVGRLALGAMTCAPSPLLGRRCWRAIGPTSWPRRRRSEAVIREELPEVVVHFDPGNGLLAFGTSMKMRDLLFALIPHAGWLNLQLADGATLPDPGRPRGRDGQADPARQAPLGRGGGVARRSDPRPRADPGPRRANLTRGFGCYRGTCSSRL